MIWRDARRRAKGDGRASTVGMTAAGSHHEHSEEDTRPLALMDVAVQPLVL